MTDGDRRATAELVEAMKRLARDTSARHRAVPVTEAYEIALAAEERSERLVMDLARRLREPPVVGR